MRVVAVEMLEEDDLICVPRFSEKPKRGYPEAFDVMQVIKVEVGDPSLGLTLRIRATNVITNEKSGFHIPVGEFLLSPATGEVVLPTP